MWAILTVLMILGILLYAASVWAVTEGFENKDGKSLILNDPDEYYDRFYAGIYDPLFHTSEILSYERASFREIALEGVDRTEMRVLDACCGTAPHACWFREADIDYTGLDSSEGMLSKARENCPGAKFVKGDVRQASTFPPKSFTHVLMLHHTIYQFQNPKMLADNASYWLQPGGMCIVHAVHPDKFDPVLSLASPFAGFSLQKYSAERAVDSEIYFDQFRYQAKFQKKENDDDATWKETITFFDPAKHEGVKYREQTHSLTMPSVERVVDIFKGSGFTLKETVDLVSCGKEYQYLLYFQK